MIRCRIDLAIIHLHYPSPEPLGDLDGDSVSEASVSGTVQPSGKPWSLSHSVGVRRRTDNGRSEASIWLGGFIVACNCIGNNRRSPPGPVLTGVESIVGEGVCDKGFAFAVDSLVASAVGVEGVGDAMYGLVKGIHDVAADS